MEESCKQRVTGLKRAIVYALIGLLFISAILLSICFVIGIDMSDMSLLSAMGITGVSADFMPPYISWAIIIVLDEIVIYGIISLLVAYKENHLLSKKNMKIIFTIGTIFLFKTFIVNIVNLKFELNFFEIAYGVFLQAVSLYVPGFFEKKDMLLKEHNKEIYNRNTLKVFCLVVTIPAILIGCIFKSLYTTEHNDKLTAYADQLVSNSLEAYGYIDDSYYDENHVVSMNKKEWYEKRDYNIDDYTYYGDVNNAEDLASTKKILIDEQIDSQKISLFKNLESVIISNITLTDYSMFSEIHTKEIIIEGYVNKSELLLEAISKIPELESLKIIDVTRPNNNIFNYNNMQEYLDEFCADLSCMNSMPNLKKLYIMNSDVNNIDSIVVSEKLEHFEYTSARTIMNEFFEDVNIDKTDLQTIKLLNNCSSLKTLKMNLIHINNNNSNVFGIIEKMVLLEELRITCSEMNNNRGDLLTDNVFVDSYIDEWAALTSLKTLEISNMYLQHVEFINKLSNIEELNLHSNRINDVSFLSTLHNLRYLNLYDNCIEEINEIFECTELETLILRNAILNNYTDGNSLYGISNLSKLKYLDMSDIDYEEYKESLYDRDLAITDSGLEFGMHVYNGIEEIFELKELVELNICNCYVGDISGIKNLNNLKIIVLKNCNITDISEISSKYQSKLEYLDISDNKVFLENDLKSYFIDGSYNTIVVMNNTELRKLLIGDRMYDSRFTIGIGGIDLGTVFANAYDGRLNWGAK